MIEIEKCLSVIASNNGYKGSEFVPFLGLTFYRTNDLHIALDKKLSQAYILEVGQDGNIPLADRKGIVITEHHEKDDEFMRYDIYAERKYRNRRATIEFNENGTILLSDFNGFERTFAMTIKNGTVQLVVSRADGDILEHHNVNIINTNDIINELQAILINSFVLHNDNPLEGYIDDEYIGEMIGYIIPALVLHVLEFNRKCAARVSKVKEAVSEKIIKAKSKQNTEELRNLQDFYEALEDAETWYSELEKAEYQTPTMETR